MLDAWASPIVGVQVNVYNAPGDPPVVYTVQETMDDPNDPLGAVPPQFVTWFNVGDPNLVNSSFNSTSLIFPSTLFVFLLSKYR
jgi:hypothetical protein